MRRIIVGMLTLFLLAGNAQAAKKKPSKPKAPKGTIQLSSSNLIEANDASGKFLCGAVRGWEPGKLTGKGKAYFLPLRVEINNMKKSRNASNKKIKALQSKLKKGKAACAAAAGSTPGNTTRPTPLPDYLSLEKYSGTFGEAEARMLYDRFGFGAKASDVTTALQLGLPATISYMTTYVYDPNLETTVGDLACDGELESEGDADNRVCEANGVNFDGVRYGIYRRINRSQTPFFEKMFFWLHDERMSATALNNLNSRDYYAIMPHINVLRNAAISGNYRNYIVEMNRDDLGHRISLDGGSNNGFSPNENYAREVLELGTVGATDLDGKPVYDDRDIEQNALAFSGIWNSFHAVGPKILFHDTPYQTTVENKDDATAAMFNHPRTAEHLAEDLWKEFINPFATPAAIRALASLIRDNDYNLIPVMRVIMESKAVFAPESRKSLIKHPLEVIGGMMRSTELAASNYWIDNALERMTQLPLLPPTVFGWNEQKLASEALVYDWRNAIGDITNDSTAQARAGFTLSDLGSIPDPNISRARQTVEKVTRMLNVAGTPDSLGRLITFLDYDMRSCNAQSASQGRLCYGPGNGYYIQSGTFSPANGNFTTKIRNLLIMTATLPDYRMK